MRVERLRQWSKANWFLLVAPALILLAWFVSRSTPWEQDARAMEAALLFDACVTVPALYALCYARALALWQLAVRMAGIACLGIYLVSWIVPAELQSLLPGFAWARTVGLAVLILIELRILLASIRLVFGTGVTAEQLSARTGAPPLVARLMVLEARMWKGLARFIFRR